MQTFYALVLILSIQGWPVDDIHVGNALYPSVEACDAKGQDALDEFENDIKDGNTSATLSYICVDQATANRLMTQRAVAL